jgi:hypothetical protein
MSLPLAEYDEKIGRHLKYIREGADMIVRHVDQMVFRPDFESLAEAEIEKAETWLVTALERVRRAKAEFRKKPVDG